MNKPVYQKETGIILFVVPYGESDAIAKAFTKDLGYVSFFSKNALGRGRFLMFEPFSLGDFSFEEGASSLLKLREFICTEAHLPLRESLERIESASLMARAIEKTQGPGLSAPALFTLLTLYLRWMPKALDPMVLAASFYLKLLQHEGLFFYSGLCQECEQELIEGEMCEGGVRCMHCKIGTGWSLNKEEMHLFALLSLAREFKDLKDERLPEGFLSKIHHFFDAATNE